MTPVIAMDFKTAIQSMINPKLVALKAAHPEINLQRQAQVAAEASIIGQTGWRNALDLPVEQLPPGLQQTTQQQPVHANHNVFFHICIIGKIVYIEYHGQIN